MSRHRVVGLALIACVGVLASCSDKSSATARSDPAGVTGQVASPGATTAAGATVDKITVAGDSISVGLGSALREAAPEDVTLKVIGEVGTGLARPDDFDWPARLRELSTDFPPDVLVFSLSSNDAQDLVDDDGEVVASFSDEEAWDAEYSARLAESFDAVRGTDTKVLWVGHVRTSKDKVGLTNRRIQALAEQVAATRPWVTVTDLASILGTGDDVAKACLVADGLHLKTNCLDMAAQEILTAPPIA
jgi:uncharacterized protein